MRSEAEIRREIEARLRRRGLLLLNGGLWSAAVFILSQIFPSRSLGTTLTSLIVLWMLAWTAVLGLHFLRTVYVELREWLVRRAIDREQRIYYVNSTYEKRKRVDVLPPLEDDEEIIEDALVDFPEAVRRKRER